MRTLPSAVLALALVLCGEAVSAQVTQPGGGGTGLSSVPPHSVLFGQGSAPFTFVTPPTKPGSVLTETGPNTDPVWGAARTILQSATNLYVSTTGIDTGNDCEVSSSPCLTLQRAWNQFAKKLDTNGQFVTVNIAPGTYSGFLASGVTVGGTIPLFTATTPGSVTVAGNVNNAIEVANGASLQISGLVLTATATSPQQSQGNDIVALSGGVVFVGPNVTFSTCQSAQIYSSTNGLVFLQNSYSINGSCPYHYYAVALGQIFSQPNLTVTLSGNPVFSSQFAKAWDLGFIQTSPITFVGSAGSGTQQYSVILNGVIDAGGGCGQYPGNVAGMIGSGGQCN